MQRLSLSPSVLGPRGLDFSPADEVSLGVVMPVDDRRTVIDGRRYGERLRYFEAASFSAITSEASRDFGTSTPPLFNS